MKSNSSARDHAPNTCAATPKSAASWLPIEGAPTDGTSFLALQDGEVWRAYGARHPETQKPYFVRRTHERQQGRTYRLMEVEIDGVWGQHRVLTAEQPDDYQFHWVSWSRGFDFAPTHWAPLPAVAREHSSPRQVEPPIRDEPLLPSPLEGCE